MSLVIDPPPKLRAQEQCAQREEARARAVVVITFDSQEGLQDAFGRAVSPQAAEVVAGRVKTVLRQHMSTRATWLSETPRGEQLGRPGLALLLANERDNDLLATCAELQLVLSRPLTMDGRTVLPSVHVHDCRCPAAACDAATASARR